MPMPAAKTPAEPRREATYADIEALPEHVVGEIIDGELVVSPRPRSRHARTATIMGSDLSTAFDRKPNGPDRPGGWWVLFEPELHFGKQVLVPDVAGWCHERLPDLLDVPYFTLAPDWVCEVISPQSGRRDRIQKARIYAQNGVQWFWLVDPLQHVIEVLERQGEHWRLVDTWGGDDAAAKMPPFDAIGLELGRWWLPLSNDSGT
ncbi:MAG: Uma2 family endonuclease [Myxococcales bacterium]|nr:Uma2 family endonuclease [Myxococcales bacterium]